MAKLTYIVTYIFIQYSLISCAPTINANVFSFASFYADHMVLQRAPYKASIWGYTTDSSTVSITFMGKQYQSTPKTVNWSNSSIWKIILDPQPASISSVNLTFTQTTSTGQLLTIQLNDVLFGDVWICSGQSNMGLPLSYVFNGTQEVQNSYLYPNIRLFQAALIASPIPTYDLLGITDNWSLPSNKSLPGFSATCWYYGRNVYEKLNIPIGLVETCWGGTIIEQWSSPQVLNICKTPSFSSDSTLYNSMIHPFLNMTIYGAIWYQGETNTEYDTNLYNCTFPAMIDDWRYKWFEGTEGLTNPGFVFGFVQLGNGNIENITTGTYPWMRFHQTADFGYAPNQRQKNVFMATAVDLVDNYPNNSHPSYVHSRFKADVGYRLAMSGLNLAYGMSTIESSPPRLGSISYSNSVATLQFVSEFQPVEFDLHNIDGFDVCCNSTQCLNNENTPWQSILGINVNGATVSFNLPSNCTELNYVRYLWRQKPCEFKKCSLYAARSQLPVYPFLAEVVNKN